MSMPITATTKELAELINLHLGENLETNPAWEILDSPISGRGIFATRDLEEGDVILKESALLAGPTANKSSKLNTCCVCYCELIGACDADIMCRNGCTLPVCPKCVTSARHAVECELFCKWQPKDTSKINSQSLRIVSIIRCFFLNELQRKLLYALQANPDKYYMVEVQRASDCFKYFPKEQDMLDYFYRTICAFNTNAFEGRSNVGGHEVLIRALFPCAGLLNHQCTPNANHHFENGETIIVTAAKRIAKGEEIVSTYTKILWNNLARKIFLNMTKHFTCECQRCLDPTVSGVNVKISFVLESH